MPVQSPLHLDVVIQRPGEETEHGPFPLGQAADAVARGSFALTDDARLRGERRWAKLGDILETHGVPIPSIAPRLVFASKSPEQRHPLVASVLDLGIRDLYLFFLKTLLAWWLAGLTILLASSVLFVIAALLGLSLGLRVFESMHLWPRP